MYCAKCGKEIADTAVKCAHCGAVQPAKADQIDKGSWWLSFFFPLVGAILYYVWKPTKPNQAKQANKASLMGCGTWLVLGIILRFVLRIIGG